MRKNILALSIATMIGGLGLASGANAGSFPGVAVATTATVLEFNGRDVGHQLIVPYFTTQNGQATLINVTNHDQTNGKAVKVRFRGAANSDDIFDFTLFLSKGDHWSAAVSQGADGRSVLRTVDKSCTLPASVATNADGTAFVTDRLPASASAADKAKGTREGYIEIFNMADVPDNGHAAPQPDLAKAITHVSGVAPCTAATFSGLATYANIDSTAELEARGFRAPTTGLSAIWTIIDVPNSTTFSGNATAIEARVAAGGAAGTGRMVVFSQTGNPVGQALADSTTADPLLRGAAPKVAPAQYDLPDLSTPYVGAAAFAPLAGDTIPLGNASRLTAALAVPNTQNEFVTSTDIAGKTDWVFSMPTRRYNVALDYSASPAARVFSDFTTAAAPNNINFFTAANTSVASGQICVTGITPKQYDREENSPTVSNDFVVSPGTPGQPLSFCGEVSVLSFNDAGGNSALSSSVARKDIDFGTIRNGWATLAHPGLAGTTGLPVLGSAHMKFSNGAARPGIAANYGVTYPHKVVR
jgi:hypothetical protein